MTASPGDQQQSTVDLSVLLVVDRTCESPQELIGSLQSVFASGLSGATYELRLLVLDERAAEAFDVDSAVIVHTEHRQYGAALQAAGREARGDYVLILDSSSAYDPHFIARMFEYRDENTIVLASRFVKQGCLTASLLRRIVSRISNNLLRRALSLPVQDLTCGFRLMPKRLFEQYDFQCDGFGFLIEMLVQWYSDGRRIREIPFHFLARRRAFGKGLTVSLIQSVYHAWRLRNSVDAADYDERAYHSIIPPQRYWQRKRFSLINSMIDRTGAILDCGCGSSRIIQSFPQAIAMDVQSNKLRYLSETNPYRVRASTFQLPFRSDSFDTVISSQVIEHIPKTDDIFSEWHRVLKPGGTLIVGTPDYDNWQWIWIEFLYKHLVPGGYADEHISHYSLRSLKEILTGYAFRYEEHKYILKGELIMKFTKE